MHDERTSPYWGSPADFSYDSNGDSGYQDSAGNIYPPLTPPEGWDPAEELAFILRDAVEAEQSKIPAARSGEPPDPGFHREALVQITAELPPVKAMARGHRRMRERRRDKLPTMSYCIAAVATVIASTVSVFGGLIAYDPLLFIAGRTESSIASWWPLLVFGPWLVGSLSILRAALHQRRAFHSWCVVLVFSSIAMAMCVAQAPDGILDRAAAALPSFASLACFQQLVRQITLTRPPRRTLPRHRLQPAEASTGEAPLDKKREHNKSAAPTGKAGQRLRA
jgi:hypothetical protein